MLRSSLLIFLLTSVDAVNNNIFNTWQVPTQQSEVAANNDADNAVYVSGQTLNLRWTFDHTDDWTLTLYRYMPAAPYVRAENDTFVAIRGTDESHIRYHEVPLLTCSHSSAFNANDELYPFDEAGWNWVISTETLGYAPPMSTYWLEMKRNSSSPDSSQPHVTDFATRHFNITDDASKAKAEKAATNNSLSTGAKVRIGVIVALGVLLLLAAAAFLLRRRRNIRRRNAGIGSFQLGEAAADTQHSSTDMKAELGGVSTDPHMAAEKRGSLHEVHGQQRSMNAELEEQNAVELQGKHRTEMDGQHISELPAYH